MGLGKRVDVLQAAVVTLSTGVASNSYRQVDGALEALDMVQELPTRAERLAKLLWIVVAFLLLSDLLPIGPLDLGLLPDLHIGLWLTGHPYAVDAAQHLYHTNPVAPHVLGVSLPWRGLDLF